MVGESGRIFIRPKLKYLRILDSALKFEWPDFSLSLNFDIKGDYDQGLARTTFDGNFAGISFSFRNTLGMKMEIPMVTSRLTSLISTKVKG